jgi:hypothetical protein
VGAAVNGLAVGAAIIANLAFEPIQWELYVVLLLLLAALGLMVWRKKQPLLFFYAAGCISGLAATIGYKLLA